MSLNLEEIVRMAKERGSSDIHISPEGPLMIRVDGSLVPVSEQYLTAQDTEELARGMLSEKHWNILVENGEVDCSHAIEGCARMRVNAFREKGGYAMVFRLLAVDIPKAENLGIPKAVMELTTKRRGLVLVTGATGSGKSTTLASLIDIISRTYQKNIITLEDPIEYVHSYHKSAIVQREIGQDTLSYANALRAALRQDPDVILVGEMRDLETISTAITAAETGHLVFSTLHTNSAASTIDRVIDVFPPHQQQQIRVQLANVLEGVIAQQLLPKLRGGRVAAFEVMLGTSAVRNMIREGKTHQIASALQTGKREGMQTMDDAIIELYMRREITPETALAFSHNPAVVKEKVTFM